MSRLPSSPNEATRKPQVSSPMDRDRSARRRAAPWLIAVFALLVWLAPVQAQGLRVAEIEIRGNQRINTTAIQAVLTTKVGDEVSPERLEGDRRAIEALGWFQIVNPPVVQNVPNGVRVIFVLREWPAIQSLTYRGSSLYSDEELLMAGKTQVGDVFNIVTWAEGKAAINELYAAKGYVVNVIDNRAEPEFLQGILVVEIQELRVGSVTIRWPTREIKDKDGNVVRTVSRHKTKNYVVMRELSQREGDLYNQDQVSKDFRALQRLNIFETINPSVDVTTEQTVAIIWEFTEKRTGQVSVGAGFSARQNLIGRAELADSNFQGRGVGIRIAVEHGAFGTDGRPSFEMSFFQPWLNSDKTSLTVSLFDRLNFRFSSSLGRRGSKLGDDRFFERRTGGRITFGRPFGWPVSVGIRGERVTTGNLPRGGAGLPPQNGTVIGLPIRFESNTRDYPQYPTAGTVKALNNEFGITKLDSSTRGGAGNSSFFDKISADYRRYIRLQPLRARQEPERQQQAQQVQVIAFRVLVGTTAGNTPFFEQYFVGGSETIRGYREDRFWGRHMFVASVEYRRPVMKRIVAVLFADTGHAWGSPKAFQFKKKGLRKDFIQSGNLDPVASIGLGIRVATPIGPIRLDYGFGSEGGRTHFSFGHAF